MPSEFRNCNNVVIEALNSSQLHNFWWKLECLSPIIKWVHTLIDLIDNWKLSKELCSITESKFRLEFDQNETDVVFELGALISIIRDL